MFAYLLIAMIFWQGPTPKEAPTNTVEKNSQARRRSTPQNIALAGQNSSNGNVSGDIQKPESNDAISVRIIPPSEIGTDSKKDPYDKALVIATCALVIVGGFQIFYLWRTVKATRDNAEAARIGAQAVINSERAWLLWERETAVILDPIEIQTRPATVFFDFKNYGRTVARMIAWKFGLYITDVVDGPDSSCFDVEGTRFNPTILPQGETFPNFATFMNGQFLRRQDLDDILQHGTKMLWLCGIIRYEDALNPSVVHETKFCRRYRVWIAGQEPMFFLAGPDECNSAT